MRRTIGEIDVAVPGDGAVVAELDPLAGHLVDQHLERPCRRVDPEQATDAIADDQRAVHRYFDAERTSSRVGNLLGRAILPQPENSTVLDTDVHGATRVHNDVLGTAAGQADDGRVKRTL